jgi:drug/metabolite transporter (DMT)-like permease
MSPALVLSGVAAALLLAVGYVLQQHEAAELPAEQMRPGILLVLARRPIWLGGIGAMVGGQLLGAATLGMGSLVVVEPLLSLNVLFALPLAALASRRRLSRGDWTGAVLLVGGLTLFLAGSTPRTTVSPVMPSPKVWSLAWGALLALVLLLGLLARRRPARPRAALMGTAAGALFGMQDFLTQRAVVGVGHGVGRLLTSWIPFAVVAVAVVGLSLAQRAFGLADLSASLPGITLAEPVIGIALALGALGHGLPHRAAPLAFALGGFALMVVGVVILTRSPLVVDPHGRRHHRHHLPHLRGIHRSTPPRRPPSSPDT